MSGKSTAVCLGNKSGPLMSMGKPLQLTQGNGCCLLKLCKSSSSSTPSCHLVPSQGFPPAAAPSQSHQTLWNHMLKGMGGDFLIVWVTVENSYSVCSSVAANASHNLHPQGCNIIKRQQRKTGKRDVNKGMDVYCFHSFERQKVSFSILHNFKISNPAWCASV